MQTIHFSIHINAPKEKVWHTMLDDATYRKWTSVFNPAGSYFEGDWTSGSEILFLGNEADGTKSGMVSTVKESRPFDFVSVQHLGEMQHGERSLWYGEGTKNDEMFENYTFVETDGGTEVQVEMTSSAGFPEEFKTMFEDAWPKALLAVKELAEQ